MVRGAQWKYRKRRKLEQSNRRDLGIRLRVQSTESRTKQGDTTLDGLSRAYLIRADIGLWTGSGLILELSHELIAQSKTAWCLGVSLSASR